MFRALCLVVVAATVFAAHPLGQSSTAPARRTTSPASKPATIVNLNSATAGYRQNNGMLEALLVDYYREGELRYAGEVREGLSKWNRAELADPLWMRAVACPFVDLTQDGS